MAEIKHNIAERTCANCAYWEGQRLTDEALGISFINPNEVAKCTNEQSPDRYQEVTPSHSCDFWKDAV